MRCLSVALVAALALSAGGALPAHADFADGLSGGPDFWAVTGLAPGKHLALRAEAGTQAARIGELSEGAVVRNKGCKMLGESRWCAVETPQASGWVAGTYLRETAPPGAEPGPPPLPAAVPGVPRGNGEAFTATGTVPCAAHKGQPSTACAFGVIRAGAGSASLWIAFPEGGERFLQFERGEPVFTDGPGRPDFTKEDDLFLIRVGTERFEVPQAVLDGG